MSADGDTVRAALSHYYSPQRYDELFAALARLEAAEDTLAALAGEPTMVDRLREAVAQRDTLAEALRYIRDGGGPDQLPREVARAALAEAGLE